MARRFSITLALALLTAAPAQAAETAYVLDSSGPTVRVVALDGAGTSFVTLPITGLAAGDQVRSIDVRPADGKLYALVFNANGADPDTLALHRLEVGDTLVTAVPIGVSGITPTGTPSSDFNPVADRLRVVTSSGQNFRINPNTGAAVDGDAGTPGTQTDTNLSYAAGDPHAGEAPNLSGVAYTNNVAGSTSTALYGIDAKEPRRLVLSPAPNSGLLTTVVDTAIPTGFTVEGFDISPAGGAFWLRNTFFSAVVHRLDLSIGAVQTVAALDFAGVDLTILPAATYELSAPVVTVRESDGTAALTVTRSQPATGSATVPYTVQNGNAAVGEDVTGSGGRLSFAEGETSKTISLPITQDLADEGRETFTVALGDPAGNRTAGAVLGRAAATVVIEDDDGPAPGTTPTPGGTSVPVDGSAPLLALAGVPRTLRRAALLRGFTITMTPTEAAELDVALRATPKRGAFSSAYELSLFSRHLARAAGSRRLRVKPARRLVGRIRKATRLRLTVVAGDAAGNRTTVNRTIRVRR